MSPQGNDNYNDYNNYNFRDNIFCKESGIQILIKSDFIMLV